MFFSWPCFFVSTFFSLYCALFRGLELFRADRVWRSKPRRSGLWIWSGARSWTQRSTPAITTSSWAGPSLRSTSRCIFRPKKCFIFVRNLENYHIEPENNQIFAKHPPPWVTRMWYHNPPSDNFQSWFLDNRKGPKPPLFVVCPHPPAQMLL